MVLASVAKVLPCLVGLTLSLEATAQNRAVVAEGALKKEQVRNADTVFATEIAFELRSILGYQLSAPLDQEFNRRLSECIWMLTPDESDCVATDRSMLYGFQFYRQSGTLLSDGFEFSTRSSLQNLKDALINQPNQSGGFSLDRTRCMADAGLGCDFRVFTAFRAHCPKNAATCGRAETLEVYYALVFKPANGKELVVHTNLSPRKPMIIRTEHILPLGPRKCSNGLVFTGYHPKSVSSSEMEMECVPKLAAAQALCREDTTGQLLFQTLGSSINCRRDVKICREACTAALSISNPLSQCRIDQLAFNPLGPVAYRCRDNVGYTSPRLVRSRKEKDSKCLPGEVRVPGAIQVMEGCAFSFLKICFMLSEPYYTQCVRENQFLWFPDAQMQ